MNPFRVFDENKANDANNTAIRFALQEELNIFFRKILSNVIKISFIPTFFLFTQGTLD